MFWLGLSLALVSALAVNWAYSLEHDAAAALPPLSLRSPVRTVRTLVGAHAWLRAFALESAGWGLYVVALRISALALVQAVSAAGIGLLAFVSSRGMIHRIPWRGRAAVVIAFLGLVLLGLSLRGTHQVDRTPSAIGVILWVGACGFAALLVVSVLREGVPAARYGLAAGLLFADGDMAAKLVGYGSSWLVMAVPLLVAYGLGTSTLQAAFQRGGALTAAGIATLTTNAVPIVAGFVLFGERLPDGTNGMLQIAAFSSIVLSAALLGRTPQPSQSVEETWQSRQRIASVRPSREQARG